MKKEKQIKNEKKAISEIIRKADRIITLTHHEVAELFSHLKGDHLLCAALMYGAGLRLMETMRIQIRDVDFDALQLVVRDTRGRIDRTVTLPESLVSKLGIHMNHVKALFEKDQAMSLGADILSLGVAKEGSPTTPLRFAWQYLFPASKLKDQSIQGKLYRHHLDQQIIQRSVRAEARKMNLDKPVNCQSLRNSFAVHLFERGASFAQVQKELGISSKRSVETYQNMAISRPLN